MENQIFLRACMKQKVERTPIWIMRQAGRYLPEYREIRKKFSFHEMMHTPSLMSDVTLLPFERFDLDAAIMFSDILVIPESLGMSFTLVPGVGPVFNEKIESRSDIEKLSLNIEYFKNIYDGINTVRKNLSKSVSLIGFSGTAWTIACYMLEGKPSKDYSKIRLLMHNDYESFMLLMDKITDSISKYVNGQIDSGVDAIQFFDSNSLFISQDNFEKYSLPYIKDIVTTVNNRGVPSIYFARSIPSILSYLLEINCSVVGVDWSINLGTVRNTLSDKVSLQGNLDPSVLLCSNEVIEQKTKEVLKSYGRGYGHIFNLGHGITPGVNPESVQKVIQTVKNFSPQFK